MPIYEYECCSCNHHFDQRQRYDEEPVAACPRCQGKARRVLQPSPIIFKGGGFYVTDNRKTSDSDKSEVGKVTHSRKTTDTDKSEGAKSQKVK